MSNKSFEEFDIPEYLKKEILDTKDKYIKPEYGFDINMLFSDRDLDKEIYLHIIEECKNNIWFFFREIARIPSSYHRYGKQFELTPLSYAIIRAYISGCDFAVSSIYPDSQIRESIILLSIYEYITTNDFSSQKMNAAYFDFSIQDCDAYKLKMSKEIHQYTINMRKFIPSFMVLNPLFCCNLISGELFKYDSTKLTALSKIEDNPMVSNIFKKNIYVLDITSFISRLQFKLLECQAKYNKSNIRAGRFIIGIDARKLNFEDDSTRYLLHMIPIIDTEELMNKPNKFDIIFRDACEKGILVHIKDSLTATNNVYRSSIAESYLASLQ